MKTTPLAFTQCIECSRTLKQAEALKVHIPDPNGPIAYSICKTCSKEHTHQCRFCERNWFDNVIDGHSSTHAAQTGSGMVARNNAIYVCNDASCKTARAGQYLSCRRCGGWFGNDEPAFGSEDLLQSDPNKDHEVMCHHCMTTSKSDGACCAICNVLLAGRGYNVEYAHPSGCNKAARLCRTCYTTYGSEKISRCSPKAMLEPYVIPLLGDRALDTRSGVQLFDLPDANVGNPVLFAVERYIRENYGVKIEYDENWDWSYERKPNDPSTLNRLCSFMYKNYRVNIEGGAKAALGNLLGDYDKRDATGVRLELTRELNRPISDFVHEKSCWWGSYYSSMCMFKENSGLGLIEYNPEGRAVGRVWIVPSLFMPPAEGRVKARFVMPPDDIKKVNAYLLFNAYGRSCHQYANLLSGLMGQANCRFSMRPSSTNEPYINHTNGRTITYIIAPPDVVDWIQELKKKSYPKTDSASLEWEKTVVAESPAWKRSCTCPINPELTRLILQEKPAAKKIVQLWPRPTLNKGG